MTASNPYELPPEAIEEPPRGWAAMLRRIGPGLILAATVVGSGELVATTVLGAESGYTLLWLILLSCAVKVVVQHEIGRYAIGTGETTLEAFDRVPGPRAKVSWLIWMWLAMVGSLFFSIGGMLGALGEIFSMALPSVSAHFWPPVISAVTLALLYFGRYNLIEKASFVLVGLLTAMTVAGAVLLLRRPDLFSWGEVAQGLRFQFPEGGLSTALTVFGATGVGAAELASYPYWCIEKGYARFVGPREQTPAWKARAEGWLRVLSLDVVASFVVYTFATVAFFLLGAGVLHAMGQTPSGPETIQALAHMYTDVLGPWSLPLFLAGAIAVLYSTVFALTAAYSRLAADFVGMLGFYDRHDYAKRLACTRAMTALFLIAPCFTFYFVREPVVMVKVSGIVQAVLLPAMGFGVLYLVSKRLPAAIRPPRWLRGALWATSAIMLAVVAVSLTLQAIRS
ncbi:MAG: Nramp family divalent metal transporter [Bryobacterales bacterium]